MSDSWLMGALASQDAYNPQAYWPPPPAPRTEQDEVAAASEAAAQRLRRPYERANAESQSYLPAVVDVLKPETPFDYGLMLSTGGAGLVGKALLAAPRAWRIGGLAASAITTGNEAEGASAKLVKSGTHVLDLARPVPENFHRIANRKLERPLADIPVDANYRNMPPPPSPISPSSLEGQFITPLLGDPTSRGVILNKVDNIPLTVPLKTQGGHGYIDDLAGYANDPTQATTISNRVRALQRQFETDVTGAYTKMGPQSADYSSHTWGLLSRMLPNAEMTDKGRAALNKAIRERIAETPVTKEMARDDETWRRFPGVKSQNLEQFLAASPDAYRKAVIDAIELQRGKIPGVPDVVAARYAATDAPLLNAPTNSAGLSMTRLTGEKVKGTHTDYPMHLVGEGKFGLGMQLPREVMYPDLVKHFDEQGVDPAYWLRKMQMPPKGVPFGQLATPKWVDQTSGYMADVGQMGETAAFDKYLLDTFGWK
jgi:hypothetical protein